MKVNNTPLYIAVLLVFTLWSCSKEQASDLPITGISQVNIIHASPKTGSLDLAFDNNRLSLNFFNYTDWVRNVNVFSGTRGFYIYPKGSATPLLSKNLNFVQGRSYSVFIADTIGKLDAVLLRDSSRAPGSDSVRVRFVNMSPDNGSLDLYLEGSSQPIATGITYKNAADFTSLKAANGAILEVRQAGQSTVLAKSTAVNLVTGNYYTVWTTGYRALTDDHTKLRVETFWH